MSEHVGRRIGADRRPRRTRGRHRGILALAVVAALALLGACSTAEGTTGSRTGSAHKPTTAGKTTTTVSRPTGPAADVSQELTGGKGVYLGRATPDDLEAVGYQEHEYVAAGTATSCRARAGPGPSAPRSATGDRAACRGATGTRADAARGA